MRRHRDAELLHALVEDAVADRRAAPDHAVADGDEVEDLGHHARRELLRRQGQLPVRLLARERQQLVRAVRQGGDRHFAQAGQLGGLEPDARGGGRAELGGDVGRARHCQRQHGDLVREFLVGLFELDVELARAEDAAGEGNLQLAVGRLPIVNALALDLADDEPGRHGEVERVDARLLDGQVERVRHHQPGLFEPRRHAVGQLQDRGDALDAGHDGHGPAVEPVGGQRAGRGVDLPQPRR